MVFAPNSCRTPRVGGKPQHRGKFLCIPGIQSAAPLRGSRWRWRSASSRWRPAPARPKRTSRCHRSRWARASRRTSTPATRGASTVRAPFPRATARSTGLPWTASASTSTAPSPIRSNSRSTPSTPAAPPIRSACSMRSGASNSRISSTSGPAGSSSRVTAPISPVPTTPRTGRRLPTAFRIFIPMSRPAAITASHTGASSAS